MGAYTEAAWHSKQVGICIGLPFLKVYIELRPYTSRTCLAEFESVLVLCERRQLLQGGHLLEEVLDKIRLPGVEFHLGDVGNIKCKDLRQNAGNKREFGNFQNCLLLLLL